MNESDQIRTLPWISFFFLWGTLLRDPVTMTVGLGTPTRVGKAYHDWVGKQNTWGMQLDTKMPHEQTLFTDKNRYCTWCTQLSESDCHTDKNRCLSHASHTVTLIRTDLCQNMSATQVTGCLFCLVSSYNRKGKTSNQIGCAWEMFRCENFQVTQGHWTPKFQWPTHNH